MHRTSGSENTCLFKSDVFQPVGKADGGVVWADVAHGAVCCVVCATVEKYVRLGNDRLIGEPRTKQAHQPNTHNNNINDDEGTSVQYTPNKRDLREAITMHKNKEQLAAVRRGPEPRGVLHRPSMHPAQANQQRRHQSIAEDDDDDDDEDEDDDDTTEDEDDDDERQSLASKKYAIDAQTIRYFFSGLNFFTVVLLPEMLRENPPHHPCEEIKCAQQQILCIRTSSRPQAICSQMLNPLDSRLLKRQGTDV